LDAAKKERLERAGFKVGDATEFLGLTHEEEALVELRLGLSTMLRHRREAQRVSQVALAKRIGSSQSRVAKMESGDPSVSMDLLVRAIFATGATSSEIGYELIAKTSAQHL
jgi:ribosome-binding protein aMBF1 (putative translation factor)